MKLDFNGKIYEESELTANAQVIIKKLNFLQKRIPELSTEIDLLSSAELELKNALQNEMSLLDLDEIELPNKVEFK